MTEEAVCRRYLTDALKGHFKDSAVALSTSLMLLTTGFLASTLSPTHPIL